MAKFNLPRWLRTWFARKPSTIQKRKTRLGVETLEARFSPATLTWDGGGSTNAWSNALNWNDNIHIPQVGDDLVFPGGAARLTNNNDIPGLLVNSISFSGSGYTISGTDLTLGNGTSNSGFLIANAGSSNNTIGFDIIL